MHKKGDLYLLQQSNRAADFSQHNFNLIDKHIIYNGTILTHR